MTFIGKNDDASSTNLNFKINATLVKDQYYYIVVRHADINSSSGRYLLNIYRQ